MIKLFLFIFPLAIFLICSSSVYANSSVLINEFLIDPQEGQKEYVELYFPQGSFDISAYTLKDKVGTTKSLSTLQTCDNYAVYELTSASGEGWLNNSGEESLFLYDGANTQVHSLENFTNPGEGKTLGLIPDGGTDLATTEQPTKCAQNSQAIQNPPSPTPSSPPSPSTPSTIKSPTPTPKTSPTPLPKSPSPSPKKSPTTVLGEKEETLPTPSPTPSPSPSPSPKGETISKTKVASVLTGGGLVIIGASIGFFLWYQRTLKSKEEEKDKQSFSANKNA